jgi:tetratricopeptide (TPR) repeat protein
MEYALKPLSRQAIPSAIGKAKCYRFLKEPTEAESICRDILDVNPENQPALVLLILALTDQFDRSLPQVFTEAKDLLSRLKNPYERLYYEGLICERRAKAHLRRANPGSGHIAFDWFRQAMACFEKAMEIRPDGSDTAVLRWNACARSIMKNPEVAPAESVVEQMLE